MRAPWRRRPYAMVRRLFSCGAFAVAIAVPTHALAAEADECADLKAVIVAAANDFQSIRGASEPDNEWKVTREIQGYKHCHLWLDDDKSMNYACVSLPNTTTAANDKLLAEKSRAVKTCLAGALGEFTEVKGMTFAGNKSSSVSLHTGRTFDSAASLKNLMEHKPDPSLWGVTIRVARSTVPEDEPPAEFQPLDTSAVDSSSFCFTLKSLINDSAGGFSAAKGNEIIDSSWASTLSLPGTDRCTVEDMEPGLYHTCTAGEYESREAAAAAAQKLKSAIAACISPAWTMKERVSGARLSISFARSDADPKVKVRLSEPHSSKAHWAVRVDVDAPEKP